MFAIEYIFLMNRAYKYRIYPTKSQISYLENWFSMCRHLYNWNLQERISVYQETGDSISYHQQQNQLPALKKEKPWFKGVYSQVLQDALRRLDSSFKRFFRAKDGGFPRFKKRGQWDSITYSQFSNHPENSKIKVPKVGELKIKYHREIPKDAKVKTLTLIKEAGKWFACFSWEMETFSIESKQECGVAFRFLGIDLGLIDFYYPTEGKPVPVPKYFRKREKNLKRLQTRLSKAKKRTPEYSKLLQALQKAHYKIKCQRNDFLHKEANQLLSSTDILVHENLNIRGMIRRPKKKQDEQSGEYLPNGAKRKSGLNKSIADVGWSKFLTILQYKADHLGKKLVGVPPHYTSQKCSDCGTIVKKSLSTRTHRCPSCGYTANRDKNAAQNILRLGLDSLGISLEAPTIALA